MKKVCWLLILALLLGCFVGCQSAETTDAGNSTEYADVTFPEELKQEMNAARLQKDIEEFGEPGEGMRRWWDPENPLQSGYMYYGTYNGYVMYCSEIGIDSIMEKTIAGYKFEFGSWHSLSAYKDGEFYELEELFEQGLIDEEAIRIAYEQYTRINEIKSEYRKQQEESGG